MGTFLLISAFIFVSVCWLSYFEKIRSWEYSEQAPMLAVGWAVAAVALAAFLPAALGHFSISIAWICLLVIGGFGIYSTRALPDPKALLRLSGAGLIAVALFMSLKHGSQYVSNHHMDVGRYSNAASLLLNQGSVVVCQDSPNANSDDLSEIELKVVEGYYETSKSHCSVSPYFLLYPALVAFVRGHVGISNSFMLNNAVGIAAFFVMTVLLQLLVRQRVPAFVGGVLLLTNPAVSLYMRRNMTEVLALLLFLLFTTFMLMLKDSLKKSLPFLAAMVFFMLAVSRLEFVVFYAFLPISVIMTYALRAELPGKTVRSFIAACILMLIPLTLYSHGDVFNYSRNALVVLLSDKLTFLGLTAPRFHDFYLIMISLLSAVLLAACHFAMRRKSLFTIKEAYRKYIAYLLAIILVAFWMYGLFMRPLMTTETSSALASYNKYIFPRLAGFIDPLTIWIFVPLAFSILLARRALPPALAAGCVLFLYFLYNASHTPPLEWWMRRYVPVSIPISYILVVSLVNIERFRKLFYLHAPIALLFNVYISSTAIWPHSERWGSLSVLEKVASTIGEDGLQVCLKGISCTRIATPVQTHFSIPTLHVTQPLEAAHARVITDTAAQGRRVCITLLSASRLDESEWAKKHLAPRGWEFEISASWPGHKNKYLEHTNQWRIGDALQNLYSPTALWGTRLSEVQLPPGSVYCLKRADHV